MWNMIVFRMLLELLHSLRRWITALSPQTFGIDVMAEMERARHQGLTLDPGRRPRVAYAVCFDDRIGVPVGRPVRRISGATEVRSDAWKAKQRITIFRNVNRLLT